MRPWLFAIARNRCRTLLAARRDAVVAPEDFEPGFDGLAEDVKRRADLRELVHDIARLPDDQREALVLFELGGSSHAEIASVLACPPAKVKALVFQARSALIADRDARSVSCEAIREQLAVARGGLLRRGPLRRHLRQCAPCDAYRLAVAGQRDGLAALFPVIPTAGLKATVLAAAGLSGGGGTAAAAAGGAASLLGGAGATAGGGAGVTALAAKVAVTVAVAGAGVSGTVAAVDSPDPVQPSAARVAAPTPTPAPTRSAEPGRPAPRPAGRPAVAGTERRPVTTARTVPPRAPAPRRAIRRRPARLAVARRARVRAAIRRRRLATRAPRLQARVEARRRARRQARRRIAPAFTPRPRRCARCPAGARPPLRPRRPNPHRPPTATATPTATPTPVPTAVSTP